MQIGGKSVRIEAPGALLRSWATLWAPR